MMEQGSTEWRMARLGKVTAYRVADVIAKTKSGYSASRANYAAELVAERLTGVAAEGYMNAAMQWGVEKEDEARAAYEFRTGIVIEQVGFVQHPSLPDTGASPDGLAGDDGLVEIKCPNTATHIATLTGAKVPEKYITQMMWQMACTGRMWCDFISYDPRLPERMRLFVYRVHRDDALIASLEREVVTFLGEVTATVADLSHKYPVAA